jgi:hypothetical protein
MVLPVDMAAADDKRAISGTTISRQRIVQESLQKSSLV